MSPEKSSKVNMDKSLDLLSSIQSIPVQDRVLAGVMNRLNQKTILKIAPFRIRWAAAILLALLSIEAYTVLKFNMESKQYAVKSIVPISDNMLYHE
jgi:hypothetical protein